ncbi:hypothetical protein [Streptomyces sp. AgN23]|uniref:hypothetical protein n=1 Tax=Streptomyces sp. AgN23 TaxID=1188315 RepID=UPI001B33114C|nr:hypothetical protein [Streptomyces sp. AgN23]QTI87215.1 hypothetical protein AS97_39630 [Streptomyces sp. AgN23]WTB02801.1 hypothetical protein OG546_00055 [Streptomyces antimycoticus]WTB11319.1 hypothetical protein OG546_49065 [Streptomyces antimycoticus]
MTTPHSHSLTEDGVSAKTAAALRAAMQRLFDGKPQHIDGGLTKEKLWREAQVSRAIMNRATAILTEWDSHIAEHGTTTPGEARRDNEITRLRRKLAEKTRECTAISRRLEAAAIAIAVLHDDNTQLRQELAADGGRVTPLRP